MHSLVVDHEKLHIKYKMTGPLIDLTSDNNDEGYGNL